MPFFTFLKRPTDRTLVCIVYEYDKHARTHNNVFVRCTRIRRTRFDPFEQYRLLSLANTTSVHTDTRACCVIVVRVLRAYRHTRCDEPERTVGRERGRGTTVLEDLARHGRATAPRGTRRTRRDTRRSRRRNRVTSVRGRWPFSRRVARERRSRRHSSPRTRSRLAVVFCISGEISFLSSDRPTGLRTTTPRR